MISVDVNSPYGLCGREATLNEQNRTCVSMYRCRPDTHVTNSQRPDAMLVQNISPVSGDMGIRQHCAEHTPTPKSSGLTRGYEQVVPRCTYYITLTTVWNKDTGIVDREIHKPVVQY